MKLPPPENERFLRAIESASQSLLAFNALAFKLEPLTRAFDTIAASNIGSAMQLMQKQQADVNRLLSTSLEPTGALYNSMRKFQDLSLQASAATAFLEQAHTSWLNDLRGVALATEHLGSVAKLALSNISYDLAATQRLMPTIDFDIINTDLARSLSTVPDIQHSTSHLLTSYDRLAQSFQSIEHVVQLPSFILPGATREVLATGYSLGVVNPSEDGRDASRAVLEIYPVADGDRDREDSDLVALLERIGPQFVMTYRGAVSALSGDNPDRSRHVLTSLRELWNHLLRRLAPEEEVQEWAVEQRDQDLFHDGKPTRRARMDYVLKELGDEPLRRFVEADTRSMLELYTLYGRLHGLETGLTDEQLVAITRKTESYLVYILRVRNFSTE